MRTRKRISNNVTYTEATKSNTAIKYGITNKPNKEQLDNMRYVSENVFEMVRCNFRVPIAVTSFFRSKELNEKLGGSTTSQHVEGEAIDLDADVFGLVTNKEIFDYIYTNLKYDQLIWEFGDKYEPAWVHVSLSKKNTNRQQTLVAYKDSRNKTKYKVYEN